MLHNSSRRHRFVAFSHICFLFFFFSYFDVYFFWWIMHTYTKIERPFFNIFLWLNIYCIRKYIIYTFSFMSYSSDHLIIFIISIIFFIFFSLLFFLPVSSQNGGVHLSCSTILWTFFSFKIHILLYLHVLLKLTPTVLSFFDRII